MAYVANQLDPTQLQQSGTNIFQQYQNPMLTQGGGAPGGGAPSGLTKDTGGGAVGSGVGAGNTAPGAGGKTGQNQLQPQVDQTQVLAKQTQQGAPGFLGQVQQQQSDLSKRLTDEAAAYNNINSYKPSYSGQSPDVLYAGIDPGAYNRISSRLSQTQAPSAKDFKSGIDLSNPAEAALQSPAALQQYLKQQGGAGYTSGMGQLDQMLLANNPDFQKASQGILQTQQQLKQQQDQENANLQNQTQKGINQSYSGETQSIKNALGQEFSGLGQDITKRQAEQQASAQAALPGYLSTQESNIAQQIAKDRPDLAPFIKNAQAQTADTPYYTAAPGVTLSQAATPQQATEYNNLLKLIGGGGTPLDTSGVAAAGPDFKAQAYRDALLAKAQQLYVPSPTSANVVTSPSGASQGVATPSTVGIGTSGTPIVLGPEPAGSLATVAPGGGKPQVYTPGQVALSVQSGQQSGPKNPYNIPNSTLQPTVTNVGINPNDPLQFAFPSDVRAKTNIGNPSSQQVNTMLQNLTPHTYNYKPGMGLPPGPQMGVMAQDLQKSPLGAQAVSPGDGGMKQIDYGKLFPAITAALADHNERIRAIESQKKKKGF